MPRQLVSQQQKALIRGRQRGWLSRLASYTVADFVDFLLTMRASNSQEV